MKNLCATAVFALCALSGAPAYAGVAIGDVPPPIEGVEFVNTAPLRLEDLRDSVVVLQLFRTSSKICADQVVKLDDLVTTFGDRGLVVLAVTNEEKKLVDEFVAAHKPKHAIVIEKGDSSKTYGLIKGFPTAYILGADGKVAWTGNWADDAKVTIEQLLSKARRSPRLPARLAAVRDTAEAGRLMEARRTLAAELKAGTVTAEEKPSVEKMMTWIESELTKQLYAAAAKGEEGKFYESAAELERLAKECAELDVGKRAADGLKQLLSDPVRKREVDAGRHLATALSAAKMLTPGRAIPLYRAVIAKWKDTNAAKRAAELIAELEKAK